jgi:two-component system, NtrC family, nitrogen regulation sensor histidine kinase NtrY
MISKSFRLTISILVSLITVQSIVFAFVVVSQPSFFIPVTIGVFLVITVLYLIHYIEKSTRDLTHFLLSLKQGAFTGSYASGKYGKVYGELSDAMNDIVREFARLGMEKELQYQYLMALNENIQVGIISFDASGKVQMINPAARKLLQAGSINTIEDFRKIDTKLYEAIVSIKPDERLVTEALIHKERIQTGIQLKEIMLLDEKLRIILLQNLSPELETKEIEAWYQLIKVLTHEIMNSVTPIVSLSQAMQQIMGNPDGTRKDPATLTADQADDVYSSIVTIGSRSKGLLHFVGAYKEYAKPIQLKKERTDVLAMVARVTGLLKPDLDKLNINLGIRLPDEKVFSFIDQSLVEQVLINLIKNAIEAAQPGQGTIVITIENSAQGTIEISVSDNGPGIDPEILPKIFIPFFTTKPKGSGIGLSLSRQIINLHHGSMKVQSDSSGTTFTFELKTIP